MSDNIVNKHKDEIDKSQNPTTVFDEKSSPVQGANLKPLEDIRDDMKGSSKKSKDPLNLALDGIDKSLFGIIDTLGNIEKKKLDIAADANKAQQDKKKTLRERFLESGVVKSVVGSVKGAVGSTWDKITQFFIWTLIGGIVNTLIENWDEIKKQINKAVDQIKGLYDNLVPILNALVGFGKWIVGAGMKLKNMINPDDLKRTEKETEELEKALESLAVQDKDIQELIKRIEMTPNDPRLKELMEKLESAKSDEERKEIVDNFVSTHGTIDPKTFITDEKTGERLNLSETFSDPDGRVIIDGVEYKSRQEFNQLTYYVDQDGFVRKKDDNSRPWGSRFISKEGLEKRIYDKETNTNKLIGESNMQSSIFNLDDRNSAFNLDDKESVFNLRDSAFNTSSFLDKEIESRTYDLNSISNYAFDQDSSESINIFITSEEGSSSFSQVSPFIFSPSGEGNSFTIDEAQLLKLYKE